MKGFEVGLREAMRAMREGNETERREIEGWTGGAAVARGPVPDLTLKFDVWTAN